MRSRLVPVAALAVGVLLGLLLVIGVAAGLPVLAATAGAALGVAVLAVQTDTWRRTRSMRNFLRDEIRRNQVEIPGATGQVYATATQEDVVGAVRLMQAQYTGRLDRMQRALDSALAELPAQRSGTDNP